MTFDPEIVGRVPVPAPVSLGPDTGFAENFAAAYDDFVLTNAFLARENAVSRRYEDIIEDIHKQTGKRLRNPFYEHLGQQPGFDPESETSLLRPGGRRLSKQPLEAFHDQFADEAAKAGAAVPTFDEINRQADALSVAASKTAADISARSTLGGSVGSVLGNISGAVIDPPNLASMAVGSPASAGILRFMIIEGMINAGVEAVQQPVIQSRRAELGLRSGFIEGLGNVAFAAGGGFLLSGAIRGGAAGLRRILGSDDGVLPRVDRDAPRTEAQDDALAFQERFEEMRATSPFADEALGDFEHQTRLDAAMEALNQGRLPTLRGRPISAVSRAALLTDPATRVDFKALTDDAVLQSQIDEIVAGVAEQRQLLARQIFDEQEIRTPETEIAERIDDLERQLDSIDTDRPLRAFVESFGPANRSDTLAIAQLAHEAGLLPEVAKRPTILSLEAQLAREGRKVARAGERRAAIEANRARLLDDDTVDALEDIGVPVEGRDIGDVIADLRDRQEAAIFETTRAPSPTGTSDRVAVARGRFDDISDEVLRDLDNIIEAQVRSDYEGTPTVMPPVGRISEGVVFHGTNVEGRFERFEKQEAGAKTDEGKLGEGFYFDENPRTALLNTESRVDPGGTVAAEGQVIAAEVDLQNPLRLRATQEDATDTAGNWKTRLAADALGIEPVSGAQLTDAIKARGFDGVTLDFSFGTFRSREVVAFDSTQIRIVDSDKDIGALQSRVDERATVTGETSINNRLDDEIFIEDANGEIIRMRAGDILEDIDNSDRVLAEFVDCAGSAA